MLLVQASARSDRQSSVCCHVERGGLRFLCPVSVDGRILSQSSGRSIGLTEKFSVDPLYVFAFLDTFIGMLEEYLGDLSASVLKDHFDVVYQVCLMVFRYPLLYSTFLSAAGRNVGRWLPTNNRIQHTA